MSLDKSLNKIINNTDTIEDSRVVADALFHKIVTDYHGYMISGIPYQLGCIFMDYARQKNSNKPKN